MARIENIEFETNNPTEQKIRKYKRHGSEFTKDRKFMYANENIIVPVVMHCRIASLKSIEFINGSGLNLNYMVLTKEQSVLLSGEKIILQHSVPE